MYVCDIGILHEQRRPEILQSTLRESVSRFMHFALRIDRMAEQYLLIRQPFAIVPHVARCFILFRIKCKWQINYV